MKSKFYTCIGFIILIFIANNALAAESSSTSLWEISKKVTFGAGIMKNIMWAACIIVGIILISAAFSQYQIHRSSPKSVPLPVPFTYLILGLIAIAIPFLSNIMGIKQVTPKQKIEKPPGFYLDIDAP